MALHHIGQVGTLIGSKGVDHGDIGGVARALMMPNRCSSMLWLNMVMMRLVVLKRRLPFLRSETTVKFSFKYSAKQLKFSKFLMLKRLNKNMWLCLSRTSCSS